jgi:thiaminase/transcriptional activator TenA
MPVDRTPSDPSGSAFCAGAWHHVRALVDAIVDHPFNRALAEGCLDRETFRFYLVQDSLYLEAFARGLAAASVLAPGSADAATWSAAAHDALDVERDLHERWLGAPRVAGTGGDGAADAGGAFEGGGTSDEPSPTCLAYGSWLQAVALAGAYPVLVAALLPCYWVYEHVGQVVLDRTRDRPDHPYAEWIATYGSEDFARLAEAARRATTRAAAASTPAVRQRMLDAFRRATEYEWLFWDSAWRHESWPTRRWLE